jgi:hypothetical protein
MRVKPSEAAAALQRRQRRDRLPKLFDALPPAVADLRGLKLDAGVLVQSGGIGGPMWTSAAFGSCGVSTCLSLDAAVRIWPANVGGRRYLTLASSSGGCQLYLGT